MKSKPVIPLCVLFLAAGCGGGTIDSHEEAMDAKMDLVDDMVSILDTIRDKRSAERAKPRFEALEKRMQEVDEQAGKLGPPDEKTMAAAMEKMGPAMEKLFAAYARIPDDPEIQAVLGEPSFGAGAPR